MKRSKLNLANHVAADSYLQVQVVMFWRHEDRGTAEYGVLVVGVNDSRMIIDARGCRVNKVWSYREHPDLGGFILPLQ